MADNILEDKAIVLVNRYSLDDAIDLANEDTNIYLYRSTRKLEHLRFKPGKEPKLFILKPLSRKFVRQYAGAMVSDDERWELCFRASCHLVRMPTPKEPLVCPESAMVETATGIRLAPEKWVDEIAEMVGNAGIRELGRIAWERVELPRGADGPFG